MRTADIDVLGIMPALEGSFGGVQASGSDAWRGILQHVGDPRARLVTYEAGASKARAVLDARGVRGKVGVVLVWHLQLLKLLPFLRSTPRRSVVFLHGVECWRRLDPLTLRLLKRMDLILSNSDYTHERFLAFNPECKNVPHLTAPLGLDTPICGEIPTPTEPPAALMVGRMLQAEDYKGHREVIDVWPIVRERCRRSELWIVGGGDLQPRLAELARNRGVEDSVRFFGAIPNEQRNDLLARCRCLALPSRGEGFGLVYLEAMRLGRPCLVSNADAGREVVAPPEAGLAVDPDDREGMASALTQLLTPGDAWNRWSVQARTRYEQRYTGNHFRSRLLAALFGASVQEEQAERTFSVASDVA